MGLINLIGYIQIRRAVNKDKQDWLYIIKCGSYLEQKPMKMAQKLSI